MRPNNLEYLNVKMTDVDEYGPSIALALAYTRYRQDKQPGWKPSRRYLMQDIGISQRQADKTSVVWKANQAKDDIDMPKWMPKKLVKKLTTGAEVNHIDSGAEVNHHVETSEQQSGAEVNQKVVKKLTNGSNINKEITITNRVTDFSFPFDLPPLQKEYKANVLLFKNFFVFLHVTGHPSYDLPHSTGNTDIGKAAWSCIKLVSLPDDKPRDILKASIPVMESGVIKADTFLGLLFNSIEMVMTRMVANSFGDLPEGEQANLSLYRDALSNLNDLLNQSGKVAFQ